MGGDRSLASLGNLRDIAACGPSGQQKLKPGLVYRSGSLHRLSGEDFDRLKEAGLRHVVDLRSAQELVVAPDPLADDPRFVYHHLHLKIEVAQGSEPRGEGRFDLKAAYRGYLESGPASLKEIFQTLASFGDQPCLIHCTAGKDRTGVVVALLLDLLGVDRADIVADYAATQAFQDEQYFQEAAGRAAAAGIDWADYQKLLVCPPEYMQEFLDALHTHRGGAQAYLTSIGLSDADLETLVARMLK